MLSSSKRSGLLVMGVQSVISGRSQQIVNGIISQGIWRFICNILCFWLYYVAGPNGRAVSGTYCLRPLEHWDRRFESHSRHGCVSAFFYVVLSCVGRGLASG